MIQEETSKEETNLEHFILMSFSLRE